MYKKLIMITGILAQLTTYGAAVPVAPVATIAKRFDPVGIKAMFDAIERADVQALECILKSGQTNVNGVILDSEDQPTALRSALKNNCSQEVKLEIVTLLLKYGADQTAKSKGSGSGLPIHLASTSQWGSSALVEILLLNNKNVVNAKTLLGQTPLMYCLFWCEGNLTEDPPLKNTEALKKTILLKSISILDTLLSYGADINLADESGRDSFKIAQLKKNPAIIKVLNDKIKSKIVAHMRDANQELFYFPPGLLPLIADYVQ